MKKIVSIKIVLIAGAFAIIVTFFMLLRPSGSIEDFRGYCVDRPGTDTIPPGRVKVTFLGTSSLLVDDGETQLLIDGFFTRPSLFESLFTKISANEAIVKSVIAKTKMDRLKAIFVSHSHYDHVLDAPAIAGLTGAVLYGSTSTVNVGRGGGLSEKKMRLFAPGDKIAVGKFTVTVIKSRHTPYTGILGLLSPPDSRRREITAPLKQPAKMSEFVEGGTYDFLVEHGGRSLLVKGSTNYIDGSLSRYRAEVIFLGIAMLSRQSDDFRESFYRETVDALKAERVIPLHWDNFFKPLDIPLSPNSRIGDDFKSNMRFIVDKTKAGGVSLTIMKGYESVLLF